MSECARQRLRFPPTLPTGMPYRSHFAGLVFPMDTVPPDVLARLEPALSELVAFAFCFLALPMVSFLAAATAQWDFEFVLQLMPVPLLHETGKWLGIKLFGYRNPRIFHLALFGAVVTGRLVNVLGWKKLLVSLARSYSCLLLATFYRVIGFWKFQRCAQPFVWIGVNPITIYFGGKFHGERHEEFMDWPIPRGAHCRRACPWTGDR